MKAVVSGLLLVLVCLLSLVHPGTASAGTAAEPAAQPEISPAEQQDEVRQAAATGSPAASAQSLIDLARTRNALGRYTAAIDALQRALHLLDAHEQPELVAIALAGLGHAWMHSGRFAEADAALMQGLALSDSLEAGTRAALLSGRGNLCLLQDDPETALGFLDQAGNLLGDTADSLLKARILANSVRAARTTGDITERFDTARDYIAELPGSSDKADLYINIGRTAAELAADGSLDWLLRANAAYSSAEHTATASGDQRALSYALGYRGELYYRRGRDAEALTLTDRAIQTAQASDLPQALYRWQWQSGRLLQRQGESDAAIDAYRSAIHTFRTVRNNTSLPPGSTQDKDRGTAVRLHFEFADLLLRRAHTGTAGGAAQADLLEARDQIESLKAAELQDYFQDDCVTDLLRRTVRLEQVAGRTAILYPIMLEDRLELLLTLPDGLQQVTIGIPRDRIVAEVRHFRQLLEKRTTRQYLRSGMQLYNWLITPIESKLLRQRIETLVVVPDGALRTIPLGALYDDTGKKYLIEKFAIAYTPGLFLTDARPLPRDNLQLLLNGLTVSVEGYPPLPNVASELKSISSIYHNSTILLDSEFTAGNMDAALRKVPYSIVHIASHGQFSSDHDKTFLLAYNETLSIDRLEELMGLGKYRKQPVELLTLSACQTAAGDDRAALGLAGIAVKAGARSALASLWSVNDAATSELIADFYDQLADLAISKARALQHAQMKLIKDLRYRHAGYWAPYLLIGNWL